MNFFLFVVKRHADMGIGESASPPHSWSFVTTFLAASWVDRLRHSRGLATFGQLQKPCSSGKLGRTGQGVSSRWGLPSNAAYHARLCS
jgi:hypothetical protein